MPYDREFADEQQFAAVDEIGERTGGQGEQKERQIRGHLHQGYHERIRIQRGHQPTGRGGGYPAAQVGDDGGRPDHRESGMAERAPSRRVPAGPGCRHGTAAFRNAVTPFPWSLALQHRAPLVLHEQVMHVVGMLLLLRQDALEHGGVVGSLSAK